MRHSTQDRKAQEPSKTTIDSLLIERATREHVPYLLRLKEVVMVSRYRPVADERGFEDWRKIYCTEQYFTSIIDDRDAMMLSIGSLRDPVGMVVLRRMGEQLEIDDLICLYPGNGDGTRLLRACLRYAEAWGFKTVHIDIYPGHDRSEEFVSRHGFTFHGDVANEIGQPMRRWVRESA